MHCSPFKEKSNKIDTDYGREGGNKLLSKCTENGEYASAHRTLVLVEIVSANYSSKTLQRTSLNAHYNTTFRKSFFFFQNLACKGTNNLPLDQDVGLCRQWHRYSSYPNEIITRPL